MFSIQLNILIFRYNKYKNVGNHSQFYVNSFNFYSSHFKLVQHDAIPKMINFSDAYIECIWNSFLPCNSFFCCFKMKIGRMGCMLKLKTTKKRIRKGLLKRIVAPLFFYGFQIFHTNSHYQNKIKNTPVFR